MIAKKLAIAEIGPFSGRDRIEAKVCLVDVSLSDVFEFGSETTYAHCDGFPADRIGVASTA